MKDCDQSDAITDELLQGHYTTSEVAADWHVVPWRKIMAAHSPR